VTAALTATGVTGGIYLVASQLAGVAFLVLGWFFVRERNRHAARRLFLASILYLPIIMGLMVSDMNHRFTVHFELQSASRPAGDPPASQVSTSPAAYEEGL
jgi:heme O synthase-like polyprenyltransferase